MSSRSDRRIPLQCSKQQIFITCVNIKRGADINKAIVIRPAPVMAGILMILDVFGVIQNLFEMFNTR